MGKSAKENIIRKIQKALQQPVAKPFADINEQHSVFKPLSDDLEIVFAEAFIGLQGQFSFCANTGELKSQLNALFERKNWHRIYCAEEPLRHLLAYDWYADLASCNVSLTTCEMLVARTGTMVLSSAQPQGRTASVYAPAHICIAYTRQLVADLPEALADLQFKYGQQLPSFLSFASGPSRTADIEKTLVTGVHGPREVFCFLLES